MAVEAAETIASAGKDAADSFAAELDRLDTRAPGKTGMAGTGASAEMSEGDGADGLGGSENRDVDLGGPDGEVAMEKLARNAMASAKSAEALNALEILAAAAGKEFPTQPDTCYTLLATPEFFANGELRERQARYGDRFYLDQVTGRTPGEFVTNVIGHHLANRDRTIVLVPDEFAEGRLEAMHLETLKAAGIRFILASRNELLSARSAAKDNPARAAYVDNTLGAMYAYRHATTLDRTSGIYSILEFYAANRLALGGITADRYIEAVVKGDVNVLMKVFLKPMLPVDAEEDHRRVTHALIFA